MHALLPYLPYIWPATAVVALGIGLAAFGVDVLKVLQLGSLRKILQFLSGALGLVSLVSWFMYRHDPEVHYYVMSDPKLASAVWFLTGLIAFAVGLAAVGCNLLKTIKLGNLRQPLQYAAGIVGAYSLLCYFGAL